jgi:hypothetical protein
MLAAARHTSTALLAVLLLAGCTPTVGSGANAPSGKAAAPSGAGANSSRAIAVGAGPQAHYTVQEQPAAGSCHYRYDHSQPLEDPACTPGAISPAVTQVNLTSTICRKGGYTSDKAGAGPNNPKDAVETKLHTAVCAGTTTLAQAQQAIATDWSTALKTLGIG